MTEILSGKLLAQKIEKEISLILSHKKGRRPGLAFIRVGDNPNSKVYIRMKKKKCEEVGILSFDHELPVSTSEEELSDLICRLNQDLNVDGILLQLPIPPHLDPLKMIEQIDPKKDVDGFHPINMGHLLLGNSKGMIPCTPKGIHRLLVDSGLSWEGKHVVIVGRSNIVGKPLAALLMQKEPSYNATVTVVHSRSSNLESLCLEADILIAALGHPKFITKKMVRSGAIVIDVGINKLSDGSLVGDVDFEEVAPLCSHITPVPGGIGPMTIACLLSNTLQAYGHR